MAAWQELHSHLGSKACSIGIHRNMSTKGRTYILGTNTIFFLLFLGSITSIFIDIWTACLDIHACLAILHSHMWLNNCNPDQSFLSDLVLQCQTSSDTTAQHTNPGPPSNQGDLTVQSVRCAFSQWHTASRSVVTLRVNVTSTFWLLAPWHLNECKLDCEIHHNTCLHKYIPRA